MKKEPGVEVSLERGSLGELRVWVDDREVASSHRFWYPNPWSFLKRVRAAVRG